MVRTLDLGNVVQVDVHMPLYLDEKTQDGVPVVCDSCDPECVMPPEEVVIEDNAYDRVESMRGELRDDVYMDSMAFGMGCSCLQVRASPLLSRVPKGRSRGGRTHNMPFGPCVSTTGHASSARRR